MRLVMPERLTIRELTYPSGDLLDVEVVERKGLGHPPRFGDGETHSPNELFLAGPTTSFQGKPLHLARLLLIGSQRFPRPCSPAPPKPKHSPPKMSPKPPNRSSGEKQTTPVWPRLSYSARSWGSLWAFSLNRAVLALGFLAALLILFGILLRVIDHALLFGHWKPR